MLTPMRVEIRRMIPVVHAKLNLTRIIAAIAAEPLVLLASASRLEICNEDGASMMDAKDVEASFVDITSPTIFPIHMKDVETEISTVKKSSASKTRILVGKYYVSSDQPTSQSELPLYASCN
jgi:hypothetical protein